MRTDTKKEHMVMKKRQMKREDVKSEDSKIKTHTDDKEPT